MLVSSPLLQLQARDGALSLVFKWQECCTQLDKRCLDQQPSMLANNYLQVRQGREHCAVLGRKDCCLLLPGERMGRKGPPKEWASGAITWTTTLVSASTTRHLSAAMMLPILK